MKEIFITFLGRTKEMNRAFALIVDNEDVVYKEVVNYSKESTNEEIAVHLEEVSGVVIDAFTMQFSSVGGGGFKRPVRN
jgi:hypothetical protein